MDLGKQITLFIDISGMLYTYSNCIGMRFALLEAKLAIAKALRVVEFQKCEKTEVSENIFCVPVLLPV